MLQLLEKIVLPEHATLLPVSLPGKVPIGICCKYRHYFTITNILFVKNEKINKINIFIPKFAAFLF